MALDSTQDQHFSEVLASLGNRDTSIEINFENFDFSGEQWDEFLRYLSNDTHYKYVTKINLMNIRIGGQFPNTEECKKICAGLLNFCTKVGGFPGLLEINLSNINAMSGILIQDTSSTETYLYQIVSKHPGVQITATGIVFDQLQRITSNSILDESEAKFICDEESSPSRINLPAIAWSLLGVALVGAGVASAVIAMLSFVGTLAAIPAIAGVGLCAAAGALIGSGAAIFTRVGVSAVSTKFSASEDDDFDDESKPNRSPLYWSLFSVALIGAGTALAVVGVLGLIGTLGLSSLVGVGLLSAGAALMATGTTIFAGLAKDKCLDAFDEWQAGRPYQKLSIK